MLNLENLELRVREQAAYIPILDTDPFRAAKDLTKVDLRQAYELLVKAITDIKAKTPFGECSVPVLLDTILHSKKNCTWFMSFYEAVAFELGVSKESIKLPNIRNLKFTTTSSNPIFTIQIPFESYRNGEVYKIKYLKFPCDNDEDPIEFYRKQYIMQQYEVEDFQDRVLPDWYACEKVTTIFEQYNPRTNTRVKVDCVKGNFLFYLAGASDNWKLIYDVPEEMYHVVTALLFRNYGIYHKEVEEELE